VRILCRVRTERTGQSFPGSGIMMPRRFVRAMALIGGEAALINMEMGGRGG